MQPQDKERLKREREEYWNSNQGNRRLKSRIEQLERQLSINDETSTSSRNHHGPNNPNPVVVTSRDVSTNLNANNNHFGTIMGGQNERQQRRIKYD